MTIDSTTVVVRDNEAMFSTMDDEVVILNMKSNNYLGLDQIGARIWELLETPVLVSELCEQMAQEYEGSREQITAGVLRFLAELAREEMIRGSEHV